MEKIGRTANGKRVHLMEVIKHADLKQGALAELNEIGSSVRNHSTAIGNLQVKFIFQKIFLL